MLDAKFSLTSTTVGLLKQPLDSGLSRVKEQADKLYGPLYSLASRSRTLFDLHLTYKQAYGCEYIDKEWSTDERTRAVLTQEIDTTLGVDNDAILRITQNSRAMRDLIVQYASLIDDADRALFERFVGDVERQELELDDSLRPSLPFRIAMQLPDLPFYRPEFIERVLTQFRVKSRQLDTLNRPGFAVRCWRWLERLGARSAALCSKLGSRMLAPVKRPGLCTKAGDL